MPAVVVEINKEENIAVVDFGGVKREVIIGIEDVKPGDVVLVHAGLIISKVDFEALKETMELLKEIEQALQEIQAEKSTTSTLVEESRLESSGTTS